MLRPENVETIVTTHGFPSFFKDLEQMEDRDPKTDIDYEPGGVFINSPKFSDRLSVTADPFGVSPISSKNDASRQTLQNL